MLEADKNEILKDSSINKADKTIINLFIFKKLENIKSKISIYIRTIKKSIFLVFSTKKFFY